MSTHPPALDSKRVPLTVNDNLIAADSSSVRVGVIGFGYWGPNIVRNLAALDSCEMVAISDTSAVALKRASRAYPGAQLTSDASDILQSPHIDAVAVVTPAWTHFDLAKRAIEHSKHVFVEKPF